MIKNYIIVILAGVCGWLATASITDVSSVIFFAGIATAACACVLVVAIDRHEQKTRNRIKNYDRPASWHIDRR